MSEELARSDLIQVVQLPVIEERLRSMKEVVERQTRDAMALVVNDDGTTSEEDVDFLDAAFRVLLCGTHSFFNFASAFHNDSPFSSVHRKNDATLALVLTSSDDFYFIAFFHVGFHYLVIAQLRHSPPKNTAGGRHYNTSDNLVKSTSNFSHLKTTFMPSYVIFTAKTRRRLAIPILANAI